jgi:hypothetical protein
MEKEPGMIPKADESYLDVVGPVLASDESVDAAEGEATCTTTDCCPCDSVWCTIFCPPVEKI